MPWKPESYTSLSPYLLAEEAEPVVEPTRRDDDPDLRGAVHDPAGNTWWISTQAEG